MAEEHLKTAYIRKGLQLACLLVDGRIEQSLESSRLTHSDPTPAFAYTFHILPPVLKIDPSVIGYFDSVLKPSHKGKVSPAAGAPFPDKDSLRLVIEYSPLTLAQATPRYCATHMHTFAGHYTAVCNMTCRSVIRDIGLDHMEGSEAREEGLQSSPRPRLHSPAWTRIVRGLSRDPTDTDSGTAAYCSSWRDSVVLSFTTKSVEVSQLSRVPDMCLADLIERAAGSPKVLRVALSAPLKTVNYEARGITESGVAGYEPYRMAGLTGKNQVCGLADTGVDDTSCFLVDNSDAYYGPRTDRSGKVQLHRRKVVQYVASADDGDVEGGHGTHVAGSILGKSLSDYSLVDGVAPEAKLAFFDIGRWSCHTVYDY